MGEVQEQHDQLSGEDTCSLCLSSSLVRSLTLGAGPHQSCHFRRNLRSLRLVMQTAPWLCKSGWACQLRGKHRSLGVRRLCFRVIGL